MRKVVNVGSGNLKMGNLESVECGKCTVWKVKWKV